MSDLIDMLDEGADGCPRCGEHCDCPLDEAPEVVRLRARVAELERELAQRTRIGLYWKRQLNGADSRAQALVDRAEKAEAQVARVRALHFATGSAVASHGGLPATTCGSCSHFWPCPTVRSLDCDGTVS